MNINEEMKLHKWAQDMADQKSSGLSRIYGYSESLLKLKLK